MEQTKKSTLLKVVSILLIISSVLNLLTGVLAIAGGAYLSVAAVETTMVDGVAETTGVQAGGAGLTVVLGVLGILIGILNLIAGIVGLRAAKGKGNAQRCKVFAIIILVLAVIWVGFSIALNIGSPTLVANIFSGIVGLVLPILYFIGAKQVA